MFKHFIGQEGHIQDLEEKISKIQSGILISKEKNYPIDFSLKLSSNMRGLSEELQQRTMKAIQALPKQMYHIHNPEATGGGNGTKQILFNQVFSDSPGITYLAGLDQTVVDSSEALERIVELTARAETDNALLAIGLRNVPVILGIHERNSNLRIIHELFHSFTMSGDRIRIQEESPKVTPAYAEIGESTTHFYGFNNTHEKYPELARSIFAASQRANMSGNAADYYLVIRASQLGKTVTRYVLSTKNDFYGTIEEQKEFENIKNMISTQTRELGKTDIKDCLLATLKNYENIKKISKFYDSAEVEAVRDLMMNAIE